MDPREFLYPPPEILQARLHGFVKDVGCKFGRRYRNPGPLCMHAIQCGTMTLVDDADRCNRTLLPCQALHSGGEVCYSDICRRACNHGSPFSHVLHVYDTADSWLTPTVLWHMFIAATVATVVLCICALYVFWRCKLRPSGPELSALYARECSGAQVALADENVAAGEFELSRTVVPYSPNQTWLQLQQTGSNQSSQQSAIVQCRATPRFEQQVGLSSGSSACSSQRLPSRRILSEEHRQPLLDAERSRDRSGVAQPYQKQSQVLSPKSGEFIRRTSEQSSTRRSSPQLAGEQREADSQSSIETAREALQQRRNQIIELSSHDRFSSASIFVTFSMLTEEIFNRSRLYCITKLGAYEHWVISSQDVTFDDRVVGHGTFGEVRHGFLHGHTEVAVKAAVNVNQQQGVLSLANEMRLLRRIRHPNIVLFHGAMINGHTASMSLVLEWVDGSDFEKFVHSNRLAMNQATANHVTVDLSWPVRKVLVDVARSMQFLHAQLPGILHRDLKPSNVLVETIVQPPRGKVADFGLSVMEKGSGHNQRVGTPAYMAPEVQRSERYTVSADVYSFGCVMLFGISGRHPRPSLLSDAYSVVHALRGRPDLEQMLELVSNCLQQVTCDRPAMTNVLETLNSIG